MQLPSVHITVPDLPSIRDSSIGALLHFTRGTYRFPNYPGVLVNHVAAADTLGADEFLQTVGMHLCIPPARFNLSNSEDMMYMEIRDRFRLQARYTLRYPPNNKCYICKEVMTRSEFRSIALVECCQMPFHQQCLNGRKQCPYCKEPWIFLNCCVCRKAITPLRQQHFDFYAAHCHDRLPCCSADAHLLCRENIEECPSCNVSFENGFPVAPKTMEEFCRQRLISRKTQRQRKELVGWY